MADIPYKPRVRLGSLRQTTKKMMVTKISGAKVGDERLKGFLKEDKGLRRMAYGQKESTIESWRGRHYMKDVKETLKGSEEYRESVYGKRSTAAKAFRDTVKEEVRQDVTTQSAPLTKEQGEQQKRVNQARERLRQFERSKDVEKEQGKPLSSHPGDDAGKNSGKGGGQSAKTVPLAMGGGGGSASGSSTGAAPMSSVIGVTANASAGSFGSSKLPSVFGLRGRVLRVELQKQELLVHVLNAPPELAIFIGRDRAVKFGQGCHCWEARHGVPCGDVTVSDHVDIRGKIINAEFVADELYLNDADLPDFVSHLNVAESASDLPLQAPDDLAIG